MKAIDVAVGIILDATRTKVLVAQRHTDDPHHGQWEFPGGKIDAGETAETALKRELNEELDIITETPQFFTKLTHAYTHRTVNLNFYLVSEFSKQPSSAEGQPIKWMAIADLAKLNMLEANQQIIERLQSALNENQQFTGV